ncbi:MAG: hypothetical protein LBR26_09680 [Prevotella sp.]|nr:hypothetical protein [Prevotella sp.]
MNSVDETAVSTVGVLVFKDGPNANANDDTYLCYAAVTEPSKITGAGSTKTFDVDLRAAGNITGAYVINALTHRTDRLFVRSLLLNGFTLS